MKLSKEEWRRYLDEIKARASIQEIAEEAGLALRPEGACLKGLCPFHADQATPSFALYPDEGNWRCFGACQTGGDVLDLYQRLHGLSFGHAVRALADRYGVVAAGKGTGARPAPPRPSGSGSPPAAPPPIPTDSPTFQEVTAEPAETPPPPAEPVDLDDLSGFWPYGRAEAVYVYPLLGGGEVHEVRYIGKNGRKSSSLTRPSEWGLIYGLKAGEYFFSKGCWRQVNSRTPDGTPRKRLAAAQPGLYRPDVYTAVEPGEDWIFCVEGPKDAETAIALGLAATTSANGASGLQAVQAKALAGHRVAIVGDHDEAGIKGAKKRAQVLEPIAKEVRIVPPLGGEPDSGYDLTDWVEERRRGGASDDALATELRSLAETSPLQARKVEIMVTTHEKRVADEALEVIVKREPNLFRRVGYLTHVVRIQETEETDEESIRRPTGSPVIRMAQEARMREVLSDHCQFLKVTEGKNGLLERPVHPPQWCGRALLARGEWRGMPRLEMVVEGPVVRRDGSILQKPGYDKKSGLLYIPNARYERVPEDPTKADVEAALERLQEVVCDFPFKVEAHYSAWLSALLTPLARFAFWGPSPLNLIDANIRGAGKSLLADVCTMILTGRPAARMSYNQGDEEELRKAITSLALSGTQTVLIDNIRGELGDGTLDRALTATAWQDRLLGGNTIVELPLQVTWYATGNNVALTADTPRRCLHIRLESPDDRPEERTSFRHPRLLDWVLKERGTILPAALTLLRAFWAAGKPAQGLKGWGSFENWSDIVREAIVWLGLPDPAETREDLEEGADLDGSALISLVEGLEELLKDPPLYGKGTAGEIVEALGKAHEDLYKPLRAALEELLPELRSDQLPTARQMGALLRHNKGRYVGGACLRGSRRTRNGVYWSVRRRTLEEGSGPFYTLGPRDDDDDRFSGLAEGENSADLEFASQTPPESQKGDESADRVDPIPLRGNQTACKNFYIRSNFRVGVQDRHRRAFRHAAKSDEPPI